SLHGLIAADAYRIPNVWIKFSDNVIGGNFKFRDYRLSIGAGEPQPVAINPRVSAQDLIDQSKHYPLELDLDLLLRSCPFASEAIRSSLNLEPREM
ncbi:hypothetical protein N9185_00850, partial [bacterium]|nr:hypothetical protein [bacterium]